MNPRSEPKIIALVGGSGSGKTWLSQRLQELLGELASAVSLDSFYKDRSSLPMARRAALNYDHPRAIDWKAFESFLENCKAGKPAPLPCYDFKTHCRLCQPVIWNTRPLVLVDGLWLLWKASIRRLFDWSVYLDCPERTRLERRIERDCKERGRTRESVAKQFAGTVKPMHDLFVQPQKRFANQVFSKPVTEQEARILAEQLRGMIGGGVGAGRTLSLALA